MEEEAGGVRRRRQRRREKVEGEGGGGLRRRRRTGGGRKGDSSRVSAVDAVFSLIATYIHMIVSNVSIVSSKRPASYTYAKSALRVPSIGV